MEEQISANIAAVTLNTCQHHDPAQPFILCLSGENLFSALKQCAANMGIKSAMFSGLGSIAEVKIGYYQHDTHHHVCKFFSGIYEIVSLTGNITCAENKPFIHLHAGISGDTFQVSGGHIIDAYAGPATEIMIIPLTAAIHREFNPDLGIYSICIKETA